MVNLQVMSTSGSEREKKDAIKVLRLLERGRHWVLVCLLLSNVVVNESLRASFSLSLSLRKPAYSPLRSHFPRFGSRRRSRRSCGFDLPQYVFQPHAQLAPHMNPLFFPQSSSLERFALTCLAPAPTGLTKLSPGYSAITMRTLRPSYRRHLHAFCTRSCACSLSVRKGRVQLTRS